MGISQIHICKESVDEQFVIDSPLFICKIIQWYYIDNKYNIEDTFQ